jgi:VanZ family protein
MNAPAPRSTLVAWLPVMAWCAVIFLFSAQPDLRFVEDDGTDFIVRKAGHMGVFGILALLVWRGLAVTTDLRRPWAAAILFTLAYAATDEVHQSFVAGRHMAATDVLIDTAGALLAVAIAGGLLALQRRRRRHPGAAPDGTSGPNG